MIRLSHSVIVIALATLTACAQIPKLAQAPVPKVPASLVSSASLVPGQGAWPKPDWWTGFGDPLLNGLIEEALRNSPDISVAASRVVAADALAAQAGAALGPAVSLDASGGVNQQSRSLGIPLQFTPRGLQDTARIAANASFNLDLWGKNRAALVAATSEAQAARVDAEQSRLMLTTAIAAAYAEYARLWAEHDVIAAARRIRLEAANLTAQRYKAGIEARGPLRQAEARVPATDAELGAIDEAILLSRHRLAALIGAGPDRGLMIARPTLTTLSAAIPDDAGIELIGRRPDLVSARLHAEAAASRIKAAKADFYPNLNLTALVGGQALGLDNVVNSTARIANASLALSLPIFDGGRIEARYRGARADYDGAVARYDATLVTALRETADALTSRQMAEAQIADQRRAFALSQEAAAAARARWVGGLSNQLPVLIAEDAMITNQRLLSNLEARRLVFDIALIRALGGGYGSSALAKGE